MLGITIRRAVQHEIFLPRAQSFTTRKTNLINHINLQTHCLQRSNFNKPTRKTDQETLKQRLRLQIKQDFIFRVSL